MTEWFGGTVPAPLHPPPPSRPLARPPRPPTRPGAGGGRGGTGREVPPNHLFIAIASVTLREDLKLCLAIRAGLGFLALPLEGTPEFVLSSNMPRRMS